jgi:hypothetical protein
MAGVTNDDYSEFGYPDLPPVVYRLTGEPIRCARCRRVVPNEWSSCWNCTWLTMRRPV